MRTVEYFYWINSDWAYLGHDRLRELASKHGATIIYKPVQLLKVYAQTGGIILKKRSMERQAYRILELRRWSEFLGMPVVAEPKHAASDQLASCLVIAAMRAGHSPHELSNYIFRAKWVDDLDHSNPELLIELANRSGMDGKALMAAAVAPEIKEELDRNTDEAISRGVFGSPAYFVEGEHFWGQDRLEWVDRALSKIKR